MEITFEKVNNEYIAEFEITTDSNLHIEKKCAASTKLYQRTNGSGWDLVDETKNMQGAVDDFDLSALIYPKFIKVVCNAEPLYAEVTTSGEVTEIKSQSKEIEITSNGTTEVTPDAGFAYLNSVKVKTNVAQSGGGSASAWRYFSMAGLSAGDQSDFVTMVMIAKGVNPQDNSIMIVTPFAASMAGIDYDAFGFDANKRMVMSGMEITLGESFENHPLKDKITEITEEEFYNLNA